MTQPKADDTLQELMAKMAEDMKHIKMVGEEGEEGVQLPLTINSIRFIRHEAIEDYKVGTYVSVRPVDPELKGKTYLGIYLGDLPTGMHPGAAFDDRNSELIINPGMANPCIFVPDLDRVVWGYESWWGVIKGPEELKEITDEDIRQNTWYMKAMKQMSEREGGQ